MSTNQTESAWPLQKPQLLVYVELGPYNGGMMLGVCELGFSFRAVAPLKSDGPLDFAFAFDGKTRLQGTGEIAWAEEDGRTGGLKFTNVSSQFRESLRAWLADDLTPKTSGREHTPAAALPLDSIQKIKSTIREQRAEPTKPSAPQVEEKFVERPIEEAPPQPTPAATPQVFQKPIVPSPPERPPLPAAKRQPAPSSELSSRSESTFALPNLRLPMTSPPSPSSEPRAAPAMHDLPKPKPPLVAPAVPLELRRASRPIADAPPPSSFVREAFPEDFPAESPRLNRAAAAVIITLALAVILVALVLSFRREVGAALIRLGQALAGDQQSPSSPTQGQSSPVPSAPHTDPAPATSAVNSPSPSSSAQTLASTPPSQPSVSPGQSPSITAQSAQARPSAIQRIEDLPAPEDGGSGQKEFDQAKEILKGIHRQRDIQMAVALLWTGVRKGYVPAEVTLADLYARGDGVQRSCEQARVLLKAAVQKGSPEARRRLTQLKQEGCLGN